jgi:hypothetical protein
MIKFPFGNGSEALTYMLTRSNGGKRMMLDINRIIDYENGMLDEDETVALFQDLIDNDILVHLQGHYSRTARYLVEAGLCRWKGEM